MKEKELITKLNNLQAIKPADSWKKSSRQILFAQISGGEEPAAASWFEVFENLLPDRMLFIFSKPAAVVAAIALVIFGGSIAGLRAGEGTKPGDSLYIAKIISEKTQLALTFDSKGKAKLNLQFAGKRAEEAAQIVSEPADDSFKKSKIEELSSSFRKEISAAKNRLSKIASNVPAAPKSGAADDADSEVVGAGLGKSDQGLEIAAVGESPEAKVGGSTTAALDGKNLEPESATDQALAQAEKLFAQKDYQGSLNLIKELSDTIAKGDQPVAVKPIASSTVATSTNPVATSTEKQGSATTTK